MLAWYIHKPFGESNMNEPQKNRSSFSNGIGFVLAAAGSAVGLGNLWRFPYLVAQYGGGIFILVYIILALTFGFALMSTEISIGRRTQKSPIVAYREVDSRFGFLGYFATLVPIIILPYYCVIGGWVIKYMITFITGSGLEAAADTYFSDFIASPASPLLYFAIFLAATMMIVILGVNKGIEKISRFLMPLLIILSVVICIFVIRIPGSGSGIRFYLFPDVSKFSFMTICSAMGQIFFSMSLAMGIMVTYGSYTKRETNLSKSVNQIEIFDTAIALLSGFMVIPAIYVFSGEAGAKANGPGLLFVALPKIFEQMPMGNLIGILFFVLVLFAALTSSISIMEAVVSSFMDRFHISRRTGVFIAILIAVALGVPSSLGNGLWSNVQLLGMDFLTFFDYLSNSLIMPFVALCTCLLIGWFVKPKFVTDEMTRNGEQMHRKKLYQVMIKFIAPILLAIILISYSLAQFGVINM